MIKPFLEVVITLPPGVERCGRRLYDGAKGCHRAAGHEGPHERWEEHGDRSSLAYRWHDCPRCGASCSVAALGMWGHCPACWERDQPRCEHGNLAGGYCARCDSRDAELWRARGHLLTADR